MFHRRFPVARPPPAPPAPPASRPFAWIRERGGGDGSAFADLGVNLCHVAAVLGTHVLLGRLGVLVHAVSEQRIERDWQKTRFVSPVFEEFALAVSQPVECLCPIRAK